MSERISRMFGAQDMTVGRPLANLAAFSIPLLIGNLAQQMYNTVDSIIVGRYVGDNALAAVGAANPILNLLLLLFMGISTGAGILVAQYFGAHQREKLSRAVGTCLALTLFASLIIMVVGPLITPPLMRMLQTPPEVYGMAVDYLTIICVGIIGGGYYNIVSGILRGMGDSITPLLFLIVACVLNIFLDILFVARFNMAAAGVALATVIAQFISAILCIWRLMQMRDVVQLTRRSLVLDRQMTRDTIRLGLPSGLSQMIFSLASIVIQSLTNSFGPSVMACSVVVMRVDGFAMMPNFTFGAALTTFVGQNVGARRLDRVKEGVREGLAAGLAIAVVLVACILGFGEALMRMFTETEEVVQLGMHMMRILAVGYIAMAVTQSLFGVMRGAGDTVTPMWVSFVTTVVIRTPIAYLLAYLTGSPDSLFISLLTAWIMGAVITSVLYRMGVWKRKAEKVGAAMETMQVEPAVDRPEGELEA